MTTGGIVLLLMVGTSPFNALAYALAAVSTGGFSPHDASMAGLHNPLAAAAVILISLAGAVPLALYHQRYRRGWPFAWNMVQLMAILAIGALTCLLLILFMRQDRPGSISEIAYHASLLAFSAQTTAGFSSIDVAQLAPASKLTLIFSMIVGGGNGSTAGGIKVLRLLIVGRLIHLVVFRTAVSRHAVVHPHLVRRRLEENDMREVLIILSLFFLVVAGSWLPFVACGYDPMNSLFEVVSAVGTVGLSAGITGPELSPLLKGILCLDMLLGRLEILAWLVLLYPGTWFGRRA